MVLKVIWTEFAENQLKDIFDYHLSVSSLNVATRLIHFFMTYFRFSYLAQDFSLT